MTDYEIAMQRLRDHLDALDTCDEEQAGDIAIRALATFLAEYCAYRDPVPNLAYIADRFKKTLFEAYELAEENRRLAECAASLSP
jgi:hypothetical protein